MSSANDDDRDRRAYLEGLIKDPEAQLMVQRLAKRTLRLHGCLVAYEDLLALGQQGLWESAPRFDAERGTPFPDFSWGRCFGLMMNAVAVETEYQTAVTRGACIALDTERDDIEGDPDASLHAFSDRLLSGATCGLGGALMCRPSEAGEAEVIWQDAYALVMQALAEAMAALPSPAREILRLHYFENRQLKHIVGMLNLRNYAQARREHKEGLARLAAHVKARGVTPELCAAARAEPATQCLPRMPPPTEAVATSPAEAHPAGT